MRGKTFLLMLLTILSLPLLPAYAQTTSQDAEGTLGSSAFDSIPTNFVGFLAIGNYAQNNTTPNLISAGIDLLVALIISVIPYSPSLVGIGMLYVVLGAVAGLASFVLVIILSLTMVLRKKKR